MSEQIEAVFSDPAPEPDWSDRSAVIEYLVEGQRPFEGTHPFEERACESSSVEYSIARTTWQPPIRTTGCSTVAIRSERSSDRSAPPPSFYTELRIRCFRSVTARHLPTRSPVLR